jgi:hypothetical protein
MADQRPADHSSLPYPPTIILSFPCTFPLFPLHALVRFPPPVPSHQYTCLLCPSHVHPCFPCSPSLFGSLSSAFPSSYSAPTPAFPAHSVLAATVVSVLGSCSLPTYLPAFSTPLPCLDPLPALSCCYTQLPFISRYPSHCLCSLPTFLPPLLFLFTYYVAQLSTLTYY